MQRNVLAELSTLLDDLNVDGSESVWSGCDEETRNVFERLVGYVRNCTWSDNETTKFVACNFTHEQNYMPDLWQSMYPEKPAKAQSTFRSQYQAINKYLENVIPTNLANIFMRNDKAEIKLLSETIDSLYMNDTKMELQLGGQLCSLLSKFELTGNKYDVNDCLNELHAMRLLSVARNAEVLDECDEKKLAYCYFVLTRPSVIAGKLNKTRLEFIKAMLSLDTGMHLEKVDYHVVPDSYLLIAVVKNIADLMETASNVGRVTELCKMTIAEYSGSVDETLIEGLNECYNLLVSGNPLTAVRNVLLKYISMYFGISSTIVQSDAQSVSDLSVEEETHADVGFDEESHVGTDVEMHGLVTGDGGIDFIQLLQDKDSDYVEELINDIYSACDECGIEYTRSGDSLVMTTGALEVARSIVEGAEITDDTMLNTDVVNFLHLHCTKTGIQRGLSKFNSADVAYIIQEMDNGNSDFISAVKTGINIDSMNKIGDIEMVAEAKSEIEAIIETAEPSDFITDIPLDAVRDYTIEGLRNRLRMLSPNDLARVYDDILNCNEDTLRSLKY